MATTGIATNAALSQKLWAKKLESEVLKETFAARFMGKTKDSMIYVKDESSKNAGDRIRVGLRMQLTGTGVIGDATLEGNEEALTLYSDDLLLDHLRHAVRTAGRMTEQRVPYSLREEARDGLRDWYSDIIDSAFFNQVCGVTGLTTGGSTGLNATVAALPSSGTNRRIVYGPLAGDTTEGSLSSASASANFQLTIIDRAVQLAKTATPLIRPVRTPRGPRYVVFLHPTQVYNLKTDATAGRITWWEANVAFVQGGEGKESNIFTGALGEYNGCIIHESARVPLAPSTTTVRRGVLCGAMAACFATGRDHDAMAEEKFTWVEELFDYKNQLGVSAGMIWGMKKLVYNAIDFGAIVMSSHAE